MQRRDQESAIERCTRYGTSAMQDVLSTLKSILRRFKALLKQKQKLPQKLRTSKFGAFLSAIATLQTYPHCINRHRRRKYSGFARLPLSYFCPIFLRKPVSFRCSCVLTASIRCKGQRPGRASSLRMCGGRSET